MQWSQEWRVRGHLNASLMGGSAVTTGIHARNPSTPVLNFSSLGELLPSVSKQAILDVSGRRSPTTFRQLHRFVCEESLLSTIGVEPGVRCALAIPNGPELAVCLLATASVGVAVPLNPDHPRESLKSDMAATGVSIVVVQHGADNESVLVAAAELGLEVVELYPDSDFAGLFRLSENDGQHNGIRLNGPNDTAMVLTTSGTSGTKKVVPILLEDLCIGSCCIAASLELAQDDLGLNMMPLFHAGGIYRNVFAPLLAGSPMAYGPGFDPVVFWKTLLRLEFTWYYAAPTMHRMILDEAKNYSRSAGASLRFVANAAGSLQPCTQREIAERFGARVLPSYGMTECMPIACPPLEGSFPTGSSGRVLGVDVSIRSEQGQRLPANAPGQIWLRGAPLMRGYEGAANCERLNKDDWFDTGDLGYLDDDDFITITGRSKEVINRGGEIISPFEVEAALLSHPSIESALAFIAPHDELDEVVAAAIVAPGRNIDLKTLHAFLKGRLPPSKWPLALVYMDKLPRNDANKVLRISLGERLGLHSVDERSPQWERLFEAECPDRVMHQRTPIPAKPVDVDLAMVRSVVAESIPRGDHHVWRSGDTVRLAVTELSTTSEVLADSLRTKLPEYLIPRHILQLSSIPVDADQSPDEETLDKEVTRRESDHPRDALELLLYNKWSDSLQTSQIGREDDFFELGGSSILAVQLAAELRRSLHVPLESTSLFRHRTIAELAIAIGEMRASHRTRPSVEQTAGRSSQSRKSSVSFATLAVQAIPFLAFFPLRRVSGWLLFIVLWVNCFQAWNMSRTASLLTALLLTGGIIGLAFPILGVLGKWMMVGRYRRSRHALFGTDYLRWWLVHQWLSFTGLGLFQMSYAGTATYYRLLGAKVGKRTRILSDALLGEADLLTIGDDVCIDSQAVIRPFSIEPGAMELKPITIGSRSTIGMRAIVPPGCRIAADHHVAPGTIAEVGESNAASGNPGLCRPYSLHPALPWRLAARVLVSGNLLLSWLPFYAFLLLVEPLPSLLGWQTVAGWFLLPEKLSVYLLMRISMAVLGPFLYFAGVVLIKRLIIGTFQEGVGQDLPIRQFRRYLMWRLLPDGTFGGLGPLLGSNFSMVTTLYRLLGAKVGDRIYWPGSGHHLIEYDLFVCGDDVTFGSRSALLHCDGKMSKRITIEDGCTVGDRCFLSPGTIVQRNAVLGSGTTTVPDFVAPPGSTWIGFDGTRPIEVDAGKLQQANESTSRPFGRALQDGSPAYRVWPSIAHASLNISVVAGAAVYRSSLLLGALAVAVPLAEGQNICVFGFLLFTCFAVLHAVFALAALVQSVVIKWAVIGRRTAGQHPWDLSPYCQRWKIHQAFEQIHRHWFGRRALLDMVGGTVFMAWFLRAQGASIGRNVCLFPNGADPLPTEPDLLTIEEGTAIDRAILVCHLNTRGQWELGRVTLGAYTTLQSGSRVMLHGTVEDHARLREHTLVLSGEIVDAESTWRGWPGRPDMLRNPKNTSNSTAIEAHSESPKVSQERVNSELSRHEDPFLLRRNTSQGQEVDAPSGQ